jgi:hypothetical protein
VHVTQVDGTAGEEDPDGFHDAVASVCIGNAQSRYEYRISRRGVGHGDFELRAERRWVKKL